MTSKIQGCRRWVNRHCRFRSAQSDEQALTEVLGPQVQALSAALRAISAVARDHSWMQRNDPRRRLDQAIEILIEISAPRRRRATANRRPG
jgi:hypothetical protein